MAVSQCHPLLPFLAVLQPGAPSHLKWYCGLPVDCDGIKKPSYLILVCIQRQPSMYLYLSIFSYRDLWSCNKNTAVNNKLRGLWKISFEVFNFLLQGWLQLHILHFLMARTAIMTKWKKGFQVIFCICISALYYWILDFFDVVFEVMSFFFVYEACTQGLNFKLALRALN